MSALAAGLDLEACLGSGARARPGRARVRVPTGLQVRLPPGHEGQVRPRSGLALRHGITILNSPGTIDADYRGEIGVLLVNLSQEPFTLRHGDRVAQLVIASVTCAEPAWSDSGAAEIESDARARGAGGYGSTEGFGPPKAAVPSEGETS